MLEEEIEKKIYGRIEACQETLREAMESVCDAQSVVNTISYLMFLLDCAKENTRRQER